MKIIQVKRKLFQHTKKSSQIHVVQTTCFQHATEAKHPAHESTVLSVSISRYNCQEFPDDNHDYCKWRREKD